MLARTSDDELATSPSDAMREKTWRLVHRLEAEDAVRQNREQSVSVLHKRGQKSEPRTRPPFTPESQSSLTIPAKTERKDRGATGVGGLLQAGSYCSCVHCCRPLPGGVSEGMWKGDLLCWWKQISIWVWVAWASNMNIYLHWKDRSSFLHPRAQQHWSWFTDTLTWFQHCAPNKGAGETHLRINNVVYMVVFSSHRVWGGADFNSKVWFCFSHCFWIKKYLV